MLLTMEATLDRIEREAAALPVDAQAELVASLLKGAEKGAQGLLASIMGAVLSPILKPLLEAGPSVYVYLFKLKNEGVISEQTYMKAALAWGSIILASRRALPPADVAPGDDGSVLISWDREEHHLEVEVFPGDGPNELLYGNRLTNEVWSCELPATEALPRVARSKINLLTIPRK